MSEDLYWRLHALSKVMESSGRIDEHEHPSAYATILDAMNAVRSEAHLRAQPVELREEIDDEVCQIMAEHGPDGHVDGHEVLTDMVLRRVAVLAAAQPAEQKGLITDATYLGLAEDIARLTAESAALKLFALDVLEVWPLGDVDGGDLQEMAVKHGLLVGERRTEVCSEEGCNCAEYYSSEEWADGITCYRRAKWLSP